MGGKTGCSGFYRAREGSNSRGQRIHHGCSAGGMEGAITVAVRGKEAEMKMKMEIKMDEDEGGMNLKMMNTDVVVVVVVLELVREQG